MAEIIFNENSSKQHKKREKVDINYLLNLEFYEIEHTDWIYNGKNCYGNQYLKRWIGYFLDTSRPHKYCLFIDEKPSNITCVFENKKEAQSFIEKYNKINSTNIQI